MADGKRKLAFRYLKGEYLTDYSLPECIMRLQQASAIGMPGINYPRMEIELTQVENNRDVDFYYVARLTEETNRNRPHKRTNMFEIRGKLDALSGGRTRIIIDYAGLDQLLLTVIVTMSVLIATLIWAKIFGNPSGLHQDMRGALLMFIVVIGGLASTLSAYGLIVVPRISKRFHQFAQHFIIDTLNASRDV